MKNSIVHLVDDASWGGVNRLLDCLENAPFGLVHDDHKIIRLERGNWTAPVFQADVIVSHMAICWKNFSFFSKLRATHPETPMVHVEHSYSEHYVALNVEKRERFDDLLNLSYALFDKIVAVSEPQRQWIARRKYCQQSQLTLISSCVRLAPFQKISNTSPQGLVTVGAIGRFHEQKGFDILVEAFARHLPETIQLLLIGDGPERETLLKKARGKTNIIFQPSTSDPASAMGKCDIVAMPSRWEPYGLVAIEAMTANRPIFCSCVEGLKQHIGGGAIGVAENSALGWAAALTGLANRQTVDNLPRAHGAANAEWNFINSWNALIKTLKHVEQAGQRAA